MDSNVVIERRKAHRTQIGNSVVSLDLGRGQITCCLWDLSAQGACLLVPPDIELPHLFKIEIFPNSWRTATFVWRRWSQVGVEFIDPAK